MISKNIQDGIRQLFTSKDGKTTVDATMEIAKALNRIADALEEYNRNHPKQES